MRIRYFLATAALLNLAILGMPVHAQAQASLPASVANWDPDKDGTLDIAEVKKAASDKFDTLDTDHEGTLDAKELAHRIGKKTLMAADPDKDGTLSKDEYLALVEKRFKAADPDGDGTLTADELKSPAGKSLLLLLQ
jgi:Ca2+-binding EF-hand superfamily protein